MNKVSNKKHRSIGKEIGILSRQAHIFFQHQFKDYSIGHAQVMTLHFICRNNGLSQHELVQYFNLDKSSVTSQLNKLKKNGYITRITDTIDRREKKKFITQKTKMIKTDLYDKFSSWSKILLEGFGTEDCEKVFFLLDKMKTNTKQIINTIRDNEEKK